MILRHLTAVATALAVGAAAAPSAIAAPYSLSLAAPATTSVGSPVLIRATGVKPPPDQYWYEDWITLEAIPASLAPACPAAAQDAEQLAPAGYLAGGKLIAIALNPASDAAGNFANSAAYLPTTPGRILLCGYVYNEEGTTMAKAADLTLDVAAPSAAPAPPVAGAPPVPAAPSAGRAPSAGAKPVNVGRPRVRRSGRMLFCSPGRWSNAPDTFAYRWLVDGRARRHALRRTLKIAVTRHAQSVACSVSAANPAGTSTAVSRKLRVPA